MSNRQFLFIMACFMQGSLLYPMYLFHVVQHEAWLVFLIAAGIAMVLALLYVKLCALYPGKNLIEINDLVFGKIVGRIISVAYLLYFILACCLIAKETSQFVAGDMIMGVPQFLIVALLLILCVWAARYGMDFFSSSAAILSIIITAIVCLITIFLIKDMNFEYLLPVLQQEPMDYIQGIHVATVVPFGQMIIFTMFLPQVKDGKKAVPKNKYAAAADSGRQSKQLQLCAAPNGQNNPNSLYKYFVGAILLGAGLLLIVILRDILVLGPLTDILSYPSYEVIRLVEIGDIFTRIEIMVAFPLLLQLFFKMAVIFYATNIATAQICGLSSHRAIGGAVAALIAVFSSVNTNSNIQMLNWAINTIPIYCLFPQLIFPLLTYIVGTIKKRIKRVPADRPEQTPQQPAAPSHS